MKPLLPAHRAAEEFASVIDGHPSDETADRYESLAAVVTLMRTHDHPEPRAEFVDDLRSRLMLAAETDLVPVPTPAPRPSSRQVSRPRRHERHLAAAAAALVLVGGTAGMAAASQVSVPGDPLYPLKLGIEQASVALHVSDAGKGADLLGQAGTRLDEVRSLLTDGGSPAEVEWTLQSFTTTADRGSGLLFRSYQQNGDDQSIATVRSFASEQMATLAGLAPSAPPQTADAFQQAADEVAAIDQQARVLCVACTRAGPLAVPDALVGPTSAASLDTLIRQPAQMAQTQARAARALAAAAEAADRIAARQPADSQHSASGDGATTTTPDQRDPSSQVVTSSRPVKDLVDGVTGQGGLTSGLSGAVKGVTSGVTSGATGGVDSTLGGDAGTLTGQLGDTVDGTVGGLLGGLTGD